MLCRVGIFSIFCLALCSCTKQWGKFWDISPSLSAFNLVNANSTAITNFPVAGPFVFDFSVAIDITSATVNSTIGSSACTGSVQVSLDNFSTCISLKTPTLSNSDTRITITPLPFLKPVSVYQVKFSTALKSYQGAALSAIVVSSTYTTKDVGKWVFVAGFGGNIRYCTLSQSNGALGTVSSVTATGQTQFIALEPNGKFVFAQPNNTSNLYYATINQSTGAISAPPSATNAATFGLAHHPTLPILYTTVASQIKQFSINSVSGLPTAGPTLVAGATSNSGIVIHPSSKFLYWGSSGSNNVYAAQLAADGVLSAPVATTATGATNSHHPAVSPDGNFLYATDYGGATGVSYFAIDQTTGALTLRGNVAGPNPQSSTIDPTGRFIYLINTTVPSISVMSLNSSTGFPSLVQTLGVPGDPTFAAIEPSGRFLVVAYGLASNQVISYSIDQQTGVIAPINSQGATNSQGVVIY